MKQAWVERDETPDKPNPPVAIYVCQRCNVTKSLKAWLVYPALLCVQCRGLVQARLYDDEGSRL